MDIGGTSRSNVAYEGEQAQTHRHEAEKDTHEAEGYIKKGNDSWCLSNLFYSAVGNVAMVVTDGVKANLLNDDHPWKQKKYESALREWKKGFLKISNYEMQALLELLEGNHFEPSYAGKEMLIDVLRAMLQPGTDYRRTYYAALEALRQALISTEYCDALIQSQMEAVKGAPADQIVWFLLKLCEARYSDVHLYSFCECLVDAVIAQGDGEPDHSRLSHADFDAIDQACYSCMGAVRVAVNKGKLQGFINVNFDPAMQQNIPFVLADLPMGLLDSKGSKMVRLLRFGTPTIEGYVSKAMVAPEFANFLVALQFQKKMHLYVSLQSDIPQLVGDESERNKVLKALQLSHANFFFIVMDQDSDFYKQKGKYTTLSRSEFAAELHRRVYAEDHGYYFPAEWKEDPGFIKHVERLHELAFDIAFGEADTCTSIQRCRFMDVFHALLTLFCIRYSGVDSVNVACKDSIDRAMKTVSTVLQMFIIAQGNADDPGYQKIHKVFVHAPAFMVKKQSMIEGRRSCMLTAYELLDSPRGRKFIHEHAAELGFEGTGFAVKRRESQYF
jgi:hypothetical protein